MTQAKHTPTPWRVSIDGVSIVAHGANPSDGLFTLMMPNLPTTDFFAEEQPEKMAFEGQHEANAAFIVKACNAHDEMIEALKHARKVIIAASVKLNGGWSEKDAETGATTCVTSNAIAMINRAIAKAEGAK